MAYPPNTDVMAAQMPSFDVQFPTGTDAKVPVRGILQVVWRRKLLVLFVMLVIMGGAAAVVVRMTPYYISTATLLIDPQQTQALPQLPSPDGQQIDMVAVKTQVAIIQSADLAKRVVETLKLLDSPENQAQLDVSADGPAGWIAWLRKYVLGIKPPDTEPTTADRTQALAGILLTHVTASNDGKSYLVQISAQTKDAKLSAAIANTLAQTYLDFNRRLKIHAIEDANARFFDQLPPLAQKVREADGAVQRFRSDNGLMPVANATGGEGGTLAEYQLAQVNSQLVQAFSDRVQEEVRLRQITNAAHGQGQLDSVPEIVGSNLIQMLRQGQATVASKAAGLASSAGSNNPAMVALKAENANLASTITAEMGKIASSVAASANTAKAREEALRQRLDQLKALVAAQSEAGIRLRDLQNQADAAREVYLSYLHRFQQTASLGLMQQPDAELISRADVPMVPAGPKRVQLFMLATAMAMVVAVLCALLRDRFGAAIGFVSASVLEAATGLPVLGSLPKLRRGSPEASPPDIRFFHRETINHIRATLQFGGPQYRAGVVLVTSSVPKEGKSHVAEALAASVALRGVRALLIHCNQPVDTANNVPAGTGLPVRREGQQTANHLTVSEASPGLHIGRLQPLGSGPDALPSLRLARDELLALRDHYDLIVLDGPSVIACANEELLCDAVDGVLLVVRSGDTTRGVILAALRILQVYGVRTIGAVLNNVDMKQLARSGSDLAEFYNSYAADAA
jgi:succinoglycan biosynthesis transport protein ExoP